ncbi:MAG: GHKL domain-containing protein [Ignavibacteriales bacterium]|nr:GHKL domain-containing protein [Ignavibacteriales bacterium]
MAFKNFRLGVLSRVVLLSATLLLLFFLLIQTSFFATAAVVAIIITLQIAALIRYVEKTNNDLARFLRSIRYADFSQTFSGGGKGGSFEDLAAAFSEVMNEFRRARAEKEEHHQYLQTVVQHIGVGLIAFKPDGEVELINTAAKRLLGINHLKSIRSLEHSNKPLVETLFRLKSGEKGQLKSEVNGELIQFAIYATEFRMREQQYTLVSIQNIRSELEEKEMEAWQKLIRVLTHEIMNSITPISSLASTVNDLLKPVANGGDATQLSPESVDDIRGAVQTIEKRSEGLLHFVDAYRNLTRIPKPKFSIFRVSELFAQVEQLMRVQIPEKPVRFTTRVEPESLEVTADSELIEQVLINLLLNAIHAVQGQPNAEIRLTAHLDERGRLSIAVSDNGPGITEEAREKIFIPFFTTKPEGSGIGLSLSKEIMRLHRGTIQVSSKPGVETTFRLVF